jgi:LPS sulfotransferase NodH
MSGTKGLRACGCKGDYCCKRCDPERFAQYWSEWMAAVKARADATRAEAAAARRSKARRAGERYNRAKATGQPYGEGDDGE